MKFNRSFYRSAVYVHTSRSSRPDCGILYHQERGGDIHLNSLAVPSFKMGLKIPIPRYDEPVNPKPAAIETDTLREQEETYWAPDILITQASSPFEKEQWGDQLYWLKLLRCRQTINWNEANHLQIRIKADTPKEGFVVNAYYAEVHYVNDPQRWVALCTEGGHTGAPQLQQVQEMYCIEEAMELQLPGPGRYVLIVRIARPDECLPQGFIDPDELNHNDLYSLLSITRR